MEPFSDTNTLPLSIAQVDSTVYEESGPVPAPENGAAAGNSATAELSAVHEQLLAAVVTRVGEVEAAEWALDQAKSACEVQIGAALSAGVPIEDVAEAAGVCASALAQFTGEAASASQED